MRAVIYAIGIFALTRTDFASEHWLDGAVAPIIAFGFIIFLGLDLLLSGIAHDFLRFRYQRHHETGLIWWLVYVPLLARADPDGGMVGTIRVADRVLEFALMMVALLQAILLLYDALIETGL